MIKLLTQDKRLLIVAGVDNYSSSELTPLGNAINDAEYLKKTMEENFIIKKTIIFKDISSFDFRDTLDKILHDYDFKK